MDIDNLREFTIDELALYDGVNGRPAYVSIYGVIYDVSQIPSWILGLHFDTLAGRDLSNVFNDCHGGNLGVLDKLPQVGILKV